MCESNHFTADEKRMSTLIVGTLSGKSITPRRPAEQSRRPAVPFKGGRTPHVMRVDWCFPPLVRKVRFSLPGLWLREG